MIATLVLLWDVVKWLQSGPKLRKRIVLNTSYHDGKTLKKEKIDAGEIITHESYCHIELVNVGTTSTTVMGVSATHKGLKNGMKMRVGNDAFTPHYGKKLPHVLSSGEVWSCRLPMSHYEDMLEYGTPEIHISVSHLKKPVIVCATQAVNKALKRDAEKLGAP